MNTVLKRKWQAFSLPELLVVLVIIGILVLIALPNLMPLISKAKSMEAQQQLGFPAYAGKELFLYPGRVIPLRWKKSVSSMPAW